MVLQHAEHWDQIENTFLGGRAVCHNFELSLIEFSYLEETCINSFSAALSKKALHGFSFYYFISFVFLRTLARMLQLLP